jgi:hypothetical protein
MAIAVFVPTIICDCGSTYHGYSDEDIITAASSSLVDGWNYLGRPYTEKEGRLQIKFLNCKKCVDTFKKGEL